MSPIDLSCPATKDQMCGGSTHTGVVENGCAAALQHPLRRVPRPLADVLACVEDVRLAEMWSQGVFIDRRHGLAVVVLVLQS